MPEKFPATVRRAAAGALATALAAALLAPAAQASPGGSSSVAAQPLSSSENPADFSGANAFYMPPETIPSAPGSVIRSEPMQLAITLPNTGAPWPGSAKRFMYTSTTQHGDPVAVTGMEFEPVAEWKGDGPRPTVVMGSGTIGQGDQCAPSRLAPTMLGLDPVNPSVGLNYELLFANMLLSEGVRVVMSDYIGLGTPGTHTYMNRLDQGHALLDAARAIPELTGEEAAPVAFWGYSQGGGAAASAAELASSYAPDVDVRGTFAGAPPADLSQVAGAVENTLIVGVLGYTINGLLERYPENRAEVDELMNPIGKAVLTTTAGQCIFDSAVTLGPIGPTVPNATSLLTNDGTSLTSVIETNPRMRAMVDDQFIGTMAPNAPVLVANNTADDAIPHDQAAALAQRWKDLGADVEFRSVALPPLLPGSILGHAVPMFEGFEYAKDWLMGRFGVTSTTGSGGSSGSSSGSGSSPSQSPVTAGDVNTGGAGDAANEAADDTGTGTEGTADGAAGGATDATGGAAGAGAPANPLDDVVGRFRR